jgi:hypothetical protein
MTKPLVQIFMAQLEEPGVSEAAASGDEKQIVSDASHQTRQRL